MIYEKLLLNEKSLNEFLEIFLQTKYIKKILVVGLGGGTRCKMFGCERKFAEKRDEREKEKEENSEFLFI